MPTETTPEERAVQIAVEAERIYATARGREPEGHHGQLAELAADALREAEARGARRALEGLPCECVTVDYIPERPKAKGWKCHRCRALAELEGLK